MPFSQHFWTNYHADDHSSIVKSTALGQERYPALGYKTFFMLNLAEHENFSANKYENANNSWHFHIY